MVAVPDRNLEGAIRNALSLPETERLTRRQMLRLLELDAQNSGIVDLTGIEYAIELQQLLLCDNQIHDLRSLEGLTRLETLTLCANMLNDISPLASLTQLRVLDLSNNMIADIAPLFNLTLLEELGLERNGITDITPLIRLKALKTLRLADNPIADFTPLLELERTELDIEVDTSQLDPLNLVVYIPDPNLKRAIREALQLPNNTPITQQKMSELAEISAWGAGITDLTGLEYATSLRLASLVGNQIEDLRPLAGLIQLKTLALEGNPVSDISPLANLTNLKALRLAGRRISDISLLANFTRLEALTLVNLAISDITPLANLTNLTYLNLEGNDIIDYSPLANLINLKELWIYENPGTDFTPLQRLNLTEFRYDEVCDIPPLLPPVRERINNRTFPSIVQAGFGIIGLDHLTREQRVVLHDIHIGPSFDHAIGWDTTPTEPTYGLATSLGGDLPRAHEARQRRLNQNPNMVFIRGLEYHIGWDDHFPPDSDFWLRDENGQIIRKHTGHPFFNFLKPEVQNLIAQRIIAIDRCGLYDGVFFDGFGSNGAGFVGRSHFPYTDEEMTQAMLNVFRQARKHVREDFLIIVNALALKLTRFTEFINGSLMEIGEDHASGYTHATLKRVENTLSWNEENLREPRVNCLYGEAITIEPLDGPNNLRWMRVFTTMSLTHSDGYTQYVTDTKLATVITCGTIFGTLISVNLSGPKHSSPKILRVCLSANSQTAGLPTIGVGSPKQSRCPHLLLPSPTGEITPRLRLTSSPTSMAKYTSKPKTLPMSMAIGWSTSWTWCKSPTTSVKPLRQIPTAMGSVNILDLVFVAQQFIE